MKKQEDISVSVCMPVYNSSKFLRECIDSILEQTFKDFELLIVDDGSTDNTIEIIESYKDQRIRLIRNRHDYIGSCNLLLDKAKGKYIARMDSDDIMLPKRLQMQYEYMEDHPKLSVLGGHAICFDSMGKEFLLGHPGEMGMLEFLDGCCVVNPTSFIRKRDIDKYHIRYCQQYMYAEDYHFWIQILQKGLTIRNTDDVVLRYRMGKEQVSSVHSSEQALASIKIKESLCQNWYGVVRQWLELPTYTRNTKNKLTAIIAFYNEGKEVGNTIQSIRETVGDSIDIVVVNDHSSDGYDYLSEISKYDVFYIENPLHMGASAAKEKGVRCCQTDFFILLDAHMRFYSNDWADIIINTLTENENRILCCQTRVLKSQNGVISEGEPQYTYGAYVYMGSEEPMPSAKWNQNWELANLFQKQIPCVLGATYTSSKKHWKKIRGLQGLLGFGGEEAYISLKSWMEGGGCSFIDNVEVGHIYKDNPLFYCPSSIYMYNMLFTAEVLFPPFYTCKTHATLRNHNIADYRNALLILNPLHEEISNLREYYKNTLCKNDFEFICEINDVIQPKQKEELCVKKEQLNEIFEYILRHESEITKCGLYSGKLAIVIAYSLYRRYSGIAIFEERSNILFNDICECINTGTLSPSFREGYIGIGWGFLYLISHGYVALTDVEEELNTIDRMIMTLSPSRFFIYGAPTDFAGLVAYCLARIGMDMEGCSLDATFLDELRFACTQAIKNGRDRYNVREYSLILFMSRYEAKEWNCKDIEFCNIMKLPNFISKDNRFWELSMTNCVGYSINVLISINKFHITL